MLQELVTALAEVVLLEVALWVEALWVEALLEVALLEVALWMVVQLASHLVGALLWVRHWSLQESGPIFSKTLGSIYR